MFVLGILSIPVLLIIAIFSLIKKVISRPIKGGEQEQEEDGDRPKNKLQEDLANNKTTEVSSSKW